MRVRIESYNRAEGVGMIRVGVGYVEVVWFSKNSFVFFFFFKQKTAYEIYQCDWSSDVCSSDLESDILFCVKVPVLSKQSVSIPASSSIDASFETIEIGRASCRERV